MTTRKTLEEKKDQIIKQYLSTSKGRTKLAMAMANPIRQRIFPHMNQRICPICDVFVDDIFEHSKEFEDDEHKTLSVVG